jgi:hypothetical protein
MIKSLVGFSGFVGSNLVQQTKFDHCYNSKDIEQAFHTHPDLLVFSGVSGERYLANNNPDADLYKIQQAIENIKKIGPGSVILISTIDVYKTCFDVDEDSVPDVENHFAYGRNRYLLEEWIESSVKNHLIVRLPAIYGKNLKKNFIYDIIHLIPAMLSEKKFHELSEKDAFINEFYNNQGNGFYRCKELSTMERRELILYFRGIGFSSLNFTDSRCMLQFYNLEFLWDHIEISHANKLRKINLVTEPCEASEIYQTLRNSRFDNELSTGPALYNCRTKYFSLFGGEAGYIFDKEFVLKDLKNFVESR